MTNGNSYLRWLSSQTPTSWWHDSADPVEITAGVSDGAAGVTTNPLLAKRALFSASRPWASLLTALPKSLSGEEKAEEIIRQVTVKIVEMLMPVHRRTGGKEGFVCAQVNPSR